MNNLWQLDYLSKEERQRLKQFPSVIRDLKNGHLDIDILDGQHTSNFYIKPVKWWEIGKWLQKIKK
jgi:hypothetical protein